MAYEDAGIEEVVIRSCNFSGGPTAHMKYTFK